MKYINHNIPTTGRASLIKKVGLVTSHRRVMRSRRCSEATRHKTIDQPQISRITRQITRANNGQGTEITGRDGNSAPMAMLSSRDIARTTPIIQDRVDREDSGMYPLGQDHSRVSEARWAGYSYLYSSPYS